MSARERENKNKSIYVIRNTLQNLIREQSFGGPEGEEAIRNSRNEKQDY